MSLEAITKIREVESSMEQSKAEARSQVQKLAADAEREGRALLEQGRKEAAAAADAAMKKAGRRSSPRRRRTARSSRRMRASAWTRRRRRS